MTLATIFSLVVFVAVLLLLAFEVFEKSVVTISGALILILAGILTYQEALEAIDFSTIFVLVGMMILIEITRISGFFAWVTVKITSLSKGNPFFIFLFFCLFTAIFSVFFSNVTTVLIMAPITFELMKGMGRDPKPYLLAEIFVANVAGAGSFIGDPANIIIGTGAGLSFNDFIVNLLPVTAVIMIVCLLAFYFLEWDNLKPITQDLKKMFISNITVRKIQYKFLSQGINKSLVIKSLAVLALTITGFVLQNMLKIPLSIIALTGGFFLILISRHEVKIEKILESIQWDTLFFFAGLFIVVHGVEKTGLVEIVGRALAESTENYALLLIIIIWASGFISMILDNVAYVTVMVPIVINMREHLAGNPHLDLLWWALALGAVLGGNGTIIGASSNVVAIDIARKNGVMITFWSFLKYGLPFATLFLLIASGYLLIRLYYF